MKGYRIKWIFTIVVMLVSVFATTYAEQSQKKQGGKQLELIKELERMVSYGRRIVAENQDLINDASKAEKGFTGAAFEEMLKNSLLEKEKFDLAKVIKKGDRTGKALEKMLGSMKSVIDDAQGVINTKGMGFKGFLPAVFARKSLEAFNEKGTKIKGKLTARIFRNSRNAPDDWEKQALDKFMAEGYPEGQSISETVKEGNQKVLRYIKPEYYKGACLKCHGEPKGERDITGGVKEGFKEGAAGAALSFSMPVD